MSQDSKNSGDLYPDEDLEGFEVVEHMKWELIEPREFRLLLLAGRSGGEQLKASVRVFTLDSAPKYIAISYRWGTEYTQAIVCNDRTLRISENLHSALSRLRQPTQSIYVWCDAICIRQGKDDATMDEHCMQIPLMKYIYSRALRVIIDLGDDDGSLTQCLEGINAILRTPQERRKRVHLEASPTEFLGLPPFADPMWSALEALLSRPWFLRMWCVQEAVLAQDIRVIFGPHMINWEQLISVSAVYSHVCTRAARTNQTRTWDITKFNTPIFAAQALLTKWQMRNAQMAHDSSPQMSLCQLMIMTMGHHATDRRDRVYGLYGMLKPNFEEDFPVSYTESIDEFGRRLSEYFLRNGNAVWMLVYSGGLNDNNRPSWSIDPKALGEMMQADALRCLTQHDGTNAVYSAGGKSTKVDIRLDSDCIVVQGALVDVIGDTPTSVARPSDESLRQLFDFENRPQVTPMHVSNVIKWLCVIAQWAGTSETTWRTMVADFSPHLDDEYREKSGRPSAGFGRYFDLLMEYSQSIVNVDFSNMTAEEFEARHPIPPGAVKFWTAAAAPLVNRRFIRTEAGRYGLVPLVDMARSDLENFPLMTSRAQRLGCLVEHIALVGVVERGMATQNGFDDMQ